MSLLLPKTIARYLLVLLALASLPACVKRLGMPGTPAPKDQDSPIERDPVPISGSNLRDQITVENASVLCSFSTRNDSYSLLCQAAVRNRGGDQTPATSVAKGVTLNWPPPQSIQGAAIDRASCRVSDTGLSQACDITLKESSSQGSTLKVDLVVLRPATHEGTVQSALVLLPYMVHTYGFVPQIPLLLSTDDNVDTPRLRLKNAPLPPLTTDFGGLVSACSQGNRIFFASYQHVFVLENGVVSLYAGSGSPGHLSNYGDGRRFYLNGPLFLACTSKTVVVLDSANKRIVELSDLGKVKRRGETGGPKHWSDIDNGRATSSLLQDGEGIVAWEDGTVVFADAAANKIVRIAPDDSISVLAGDNATALDRPRGLTSTSDGTLYWREGDTWTLRKLSTDGLLSTVTIANPEVISHAFLNNKPQNNLGIAAQADGTLYLSQANPALIYRLDPITHLLSVVPNNSRKAKPPYAVYAYALWLMDSGHLLVTSYGNHRIVELDPTSGAATWLAGTVSPPTTVSGQDASNAYFGYTQGIAIRPDDGALIVSDDTDKRIKEITPTGGLQVLAGSLFPAPFTAQAPWQDGPALGVSMAAPGGVAVAPDGSILFVDEWRCLLRKITPTGEIVTLAGTGQIDVPNLVPGGYSGDGGPAVNAELNGPRGVAVNKLGQIFVADRRNHRVRMIDTNGIITTVAGTGRPYSRGENIAATKADIYLPTALAFGPDGALYVTEDNVGKVRRISGGIVTTIAGRGWTAGRTDPNLEEGGPALNAQLHHPSSLAFAPNGTAFLVEPDISRVRLLIPHPDDKGVTTYTISTFLGANVSQNCGSGTFQGKAAAVDLESALETSLGALCVGTPMAVAYRDNCGAPSGRKIIAIAQSFDFGTTASASSILRIEEACQ